MKWLVEGYTTILWQRRIYSCLTSAIGSCHTHLCPAQPMLCHVGKNHCSSLLCVTPGWLRVCRFCKMVTPEHHSEGGERLSFKGGLR